MVCKNPIFEWYAPNPMVITVHWKAQEARIPMFTLGVPQQACVLKSCILMHRPAPWRRGADHIMRKNKGAQRA